MKKRISLIIILVAFVLIMIIPAKNVYALNKQITTFEATQNNGEISVSGTTEAGALAVAIAIYNEDGTELITMQTTEVNSSNEFSATIALESGNYLIKVADYEGGTFSEKSITKITNNTNTEAEEKSDVEKELTNTEEATSTTNTTETTEKNTKTTVKSSNPTTGDNIIMIISVFGVAALGAFITLKLYKNNKIRKH